MKNLFQTLIISRFTLLNVIVTGLFLFSCKQETDYSKEISRLDSSYSVLVATEKRLLSLDTNSLNLAYKSISINLRNLSEKFIKDTVSKKTALLLSSAYEQAGAIGNILSNKTNLERSINKSKQAINNLKHDLKENLIKENKSAGYFVKETATSEKISNAVNKAIEKANVSFNNLDSLKRELSFLSDSLRN